MLINNSDRLDINRWWETKRLEYNKGLLISGAFSLVFAWFTIALEESAFMNIAATLIITIAFVVFYGLYMAITNLLYSLGSTLDIAFRKHNLRDILFGCGYWLSVLAIPVILLTTMAIMIISIPEHSYLLPTQ